MEVCLTQYWSSLNQLNLSFNITFHGLKPDNSTVTLVCH